MDAEGRNGPAAARVMLPRRLFHLGAGTIMAVGVLALPERAAEWTLLAASLLMIAFELVRAAAPGANDAVVRLLPLFKDAERRRITGATFMTLAAAFIVFVFERDTAALALLFLAVGDPCAALVGVRDRRLRVFGKSLLGTVAFAATATAAGALASLHSDVAFTWILAAGAVVAALVELAPLPVDDNVTIPVASASAMAALSLA